MATEQRLITYGFEAGADLSASQYCGVKLHTTGKVALGGAGKAILGVLQDKPTASGQACEVARFGITKGVVGSAGVTTAGDPVEIDSSGQFITKASGTIVGQAIQAGAAGAIIQIVLLPSNSVFV